MTIHEKEVTAIIGPSGCGKSTLIRCFNRMHETVPGSKFAGDILLEQKSIFGNTMDPVEVRRRIGMVFQKPTPFPTLSIYDNVVVGLRLNGVRDKKVLDEVVEKSLRKAAFVGGGERIRFTAPARRFRADSNNVFASPGP